jgi:hypothetical protein
LATKIKIEKDLHEKLKVCAEAAGYSSVEEFVNHVLEKEVERVLGDNDDVDMDATKERLKGLGYIS